MSNEQVLGLRIRVNDDGTIQVLNRTNQGLRDISTSAHQASRATDDTRRSFSQTALSALSMGDAVSGLVRSFAGLAAGVGFTSMIKSAVDMADNLKDLSKSTAISVENLSGLQMAAKQSGSDLESVAAAVNKLSVNIAKNGDKFKQLGIDATDPMEAFAQLADVFVSIDDPQKRAAVGAAALGKAWSSTAPLLSEGGAAIRAMIADGREASGMTTELANNADQFNDQLELMHTRLSGVAAYIAGGLVSGFNNLIDSISQSSAEMVTFGDTTATMGDYVSATWLTIGDTAQAAINGILRAFPWIPSAAKAVASFTVDVFKNAFEMLRLLASGVVNFVIGSFDAMGKYIGMTAAGIVEVFVQKFDKAKSLISGFALGVEGALSGDFSFSDFTAAYKKETLSIATVAQDVRTQVAESFSKDYLGDFGRKVEANAASLATLSAANDTVTASTKKTAVASKDAVDQFIKGGDDTEKAAAKSASAVAKAADQHQKAIAGTIAGLQFELEVNRLSDHEKELQAKLRSSLADAVGKERDQIEGLVKQIDAENIARSRQQAMWDESVKQANALTDLRRSAEGEQSLANMAKTLTMMGATNDEVAKRVELEKKLQAAVSANPDLDPQQVRDYVIAEQRAADEIAQYTNTKTDESAKWMESAFKKAAENIQDSFANMFENMLNGDATASFAKFAENIKKTLNQAISQQLALDLQNLFTGKGGLGDMFKSAMLFGVSMLTSFLSKTADARTFSASETSGNSPVTGAGAMHIADSFTRDQAYGMQSKTILEFNKSLDYLSGMIMSNVGKITDWIGGLGSKLASISVVQSVAEFFRPVTSLISQGLSSISSLYNSVTSFINTGISAITDFVGLTTAATATVVDAVSTGAAGTGTAGAAAGDAASSATASALSKVAVALSVIKFGYDMFTTWGNDALTTQTKITNSLYAASDALLSSAAALMNWPLAIAAAVLNVAGVVSDVLENGFSKSNMLRLFLGPLAGFFDKPRTPNAWMNTYSEQGGNPYSFNPNASTYTATGNKSAYVGESTPFGMTVISTHEMSLSAQEMVNSFGELLKTVKTVDINLYNTINRLDQKFNETGKTMAYYNNVLAGGARVATKQDASELNTGGMLAQRYSWIVDQLANSGSVVGQYLNAWFDVITTKFISVSQDNAIFVLGVIDSLATNMESFMAFPLALVDLIGNSVKSVSSGGTPDSVMAEITGVLNTFSMVSAGLKMMNMSADDNRIVTFLAHINAIGFGVQEAGTNLLAYGIALQKINSEVMASGNQLLDTVEAKFNEMRNKGFDNTQMNAYFGSFGLFANLFAEAKVAFSAADLDVAAQHIHALSTASVEVAKNVINHTIATEQLTNVSREVAIATLVKNGKLEEATVAEAEYGVSIQNTTKNVLDSMAFIQQWAYLSGQTLGEMGISAAVWQAAAANVVNVFGDMTTAMKTFDDIAKTFLSPTDYAQYNLDTINRSMANMQAANPALAGITAESITNALKSGLSMSSFISFISQGNGEVAKEMLTYGQLISKRIDAEKSLNEALKASSENVTSARSALTAAYKNESSALTATITKFDSFAASLRKFRDELSIGNLSTANPMDKYRAAGDQFNALMTTINAGPGTTDASKAAYDQAQTDFQAKASAFLSASRDVNASGSAYKTDYQRVLTAINNGIGSAKLAKSAPELQLDQLNKSVSLLIEINDSVLSVTDAITALKSVLLDNQLAAVVKAETINTAAQTAKKAPELRPDSVVSTAADYTDSMSNVITLSFAKDAKKNSRVISELQDQIDPLKEPILLSFAQKALGKKETGAIADMTAQVSSIPNVISLSFAQKSLGKKEAGAIADMTAQVSSIPNVISLSFAQKALAKKEINVIAAMTAQVNSIPDVVTLSFAAAEKHNTSIIEHLIDQVNSIPRVVPITLAYTQAGNVMGPMPLVEVMGPQLPTVKMPLFARGGISNQPSIFGEAGPEAAVPLPDGRSIPVTLKQPAGRSDNGDIVEQLKKALIEQQKQNTALQQALLVLQAGFSQLVARSDQQQEILESVERQLRRNAA